MAEIPRVLAEAVAENSQSTCIHYQLLEERRLHSVSSCRVAQSWSLERRAT
jgi:hypothetical protein